MGKHDVFSVSLSESRVPGAMGKRGGSSVSLSESHLVSPGTWRTRSLPVLMVNQRSMIGSLLLVLMVEQRSMIESLLTVNTGKLRAR